MLKRGSAILPGEQLALLAHVLDRVVGEALERFVDPRAGRLGLGADPLEVEHAAARQHLAAAQDLGLEPPVGCVRLR